MRRHLICAKTFASPVIEQKILNHISPDWTKNSRVLSKENHYNIEKNDDLAAVMGERIGVKFATQCIDVERRLKLFPDNLEYDTILTVQPINWSKTEVIWSARATNGPSFEVMCGQNKKLDENGMTGDTVIPWVKEIKYLGYVITPKCGCGNMIKKTKCESAAKSMHG